MITQKDIGWYLEEPTRLLQKKPFTRSGDITNGGSSEADVSITTKTQVTFSQLRMNEITQDEYLEEYDPSLHRIKWNKSIPHIAVQVGKDTIDIDNMTLVEAYQKNIHAAHTLHATSNELEFTLCNVDKTDAINSLYSEYKQQWQMRNMHNVVREAFSKQKKVGDSSVLFRYETKKKKGSVTVYSYDMGYISIPNYNEFGEQIAVSLYYKTDEGIEIIDTYDDTYFYRSYNVRDKNGEDNWVQDAPTKHGFSRCPLLYKRGSVAWEYGESIIEMIELMLNINAVALKRFGTFGLVLKGAMDKNSFVRGNSTLIINLSADESNGKQDAKTIEFPEPQKMIDYLEYLVKQLQIACSVTFMTPDSLKVGGDIGGNAVQLAMKNDLALATQTVLDWSDFTDGLALLFGEMLSLEADGIGKFNELQVKAKLSVWTPESKNTLISNLATESTWLSKQTIIENSPHSAPDELERKKKEDELDNSNIDSNNNVSATQDTTNQTI